MTTYYIAIGASVAMGLLIYYNPRLDTLPTTGQWIVWYGRGENRKYFII